VLKENLQHGVTQNERAEKNDGANNCLVQLFLLGAMTRDA
jgi:hypothetical protein